MDYGGIIKALRVEMEKVDRAIEELEVLNSPDGAQPKKRGRKSIVPFADIRWRPISLSTNRQIGSGVRSGAIWQV